MDDFTACKWCGDLLTNHTKERVTACSESLKKDWRITWSPDNQFCFLDGYGYGVSRNLTTFCKGKEADILKPQNNTGIPSTIATINVGASKRGK